MLLKSRPKTITRDPNWLGPIIAPGEILLEEFLKPLEFLHALPGLSVPGGGSGRVRSVQRSHRRTAEQRERANQIRTQDVDGARHAGTAGRRESVAIGPADEHRTSAQAQRLDDIAAAADAAVHQHLNAVSNRRNDFGKHANGCGHAVQLPSSMV